MKLRAIRLRTPLHGSVVTLSRSAIENESGSVFISQCDTPRLSPIRDRLWHDRRMDPGERAREVAADMARWRDRRWCRCRIAPTQIDTIVRTIDTERKPRTRVVDDVRDAARLSIELYDDFVAKREMDNDRISTLAARVSSEMFTDYCRTTPVSAELAAIEATIDGAAWAARNAIGDALRDLAQDCPIRAFMFRHSYTSPVYAFQYRARSFLAGIDRPCPYLGVTELYLAGCFPLGYLDDHFVVFAP
jgi:hypothetical protein